MPTRAEEPEESAAEKIYATLRECREQADPKKQKGVQMQGYLLKKKEKIGKWKQLYFVLKQDGADSHLYFYEHPKRTKPKGLIDLNCAFLYAVHETFFDKRFCFQLVEKALPCLATVTYLAAEDAGMMIIFLKVLDFLKSRISHRRAGGLVFNFEAHVRASNGEGPKGGEIARSPLSTINH